MSSLLFALAVALWVVRMVFWVAGEFPQWQKVLDKPVWIVLLLALLELRFESLAIG